MKNNLLILKSSLTIVLLLGCNFRSTAFFGSLFTPGYTGGVDYPNYVTCTWTLDIRSSPIALKFSDDAQLQDNNFTRANNRDLLQV